MGFIDFSRELLGITSDFAITSIVKDEENKSKVFWRGRLWCAIAILDR